MDFVAACAAVRTKCIAGCPRTAAGDSSGADGAGGSDRAPMGAFVRLVAIAPDRPDVSVVCAMSSADLQLDYERESVIGASLDEHAAMMMLQLEWHHGRMA
jgi:hypothetical protein